MDAKQLEASSASNLETANTETQVAVAAVEDVKQKAPDTSSEGESTQVEKKPESLLEAVRTALDKDSEEGKATDPSQKEDPSKVEPEADDAKTDEAKKAEEEAKDDKSPVPYTRFKEVIEERNAFKAEASEYRRITQFMAHNQLSPEEVAEGFRIMAAMKTNPFQAEQLLARHYDNVTKYNRANLPQDIATRVQTGEINEGSAQEIAALRNEAALRQQQEVQFAQQREAEQQANTSHAIRSAVTDWETRIQTRDVDYAAKQNLVLDRARSYLQNGRPQSPQDALALVEKAYHDVNETLKGFAPQRNAVRPPIASTQSSINSKPVAKTLKEAILGAVGAS